MVVQEAVEDIEPLLRSEDRDTMSISRGEDRRRDDAAAISYCCLVCWCIMLYIHQYSLIANIGGAHTVDMKTLLVPALLGRTALRMSLEPHRVQRRGLGCRQSALRRTTWLI